MESLAELLDGYRKERAELLTRLAWLDGSIAALERAMPAVPDATPAQVQESAPTRIVASPPVAEPGPYAMPGIYEATVAYLSTIPGEPRSAREIAEALLAGGFQTRAANFQATVRTMLHRWQARRWGIHATEQRNRWFFRA